MTEKELVNLKIEISLAKEKVAGLQGQHDLLMKQLKDTWGCKTTQEAEKALAKMEKDVEEMSATIERKMQEIQKTYQVIHG